MRIKFWGVRGSIPCPGPETSRYGGNTACLEVQLDAIQRRIIIDAGSGIRELGYQLMAEHAGGKPIRSEIFLTHTHWDHIMGFPFFTPIYMPSSQFTIYGPVTYEEEPLKEVLSGQWTYRYFPVRHEDLSSNIEYIHLKEGEYDLGQGLHLKTTYLNHPLLCLGYRFEFAGKVFCTAFDTEPFSNLFAGDPSDPGYDPDIAARGEQAANEENARVENFFSGADLLIFDSQYTEQEYCHARMGWGHGPLEYAISAAGRNRVKRLALFHHDIQRTDAQLDELALRHCTSKNGMNIFFAREGMQIDL
ncbi:MAG: MBL fold metallo-hydrolase [Desulfobacteraceae bacterium]|nr:MAG: MBL fold metallo-hydrolase [Desulfobacteraceae bacterium]